MVIEKILKRIPEYETFCTVSELDEWLERLERENPENAKSFELAVSRKGHSIRGLCIGNGKKKAVCYACPHPNEPIGALTVMTLAELFLADKGLLEETEMTWYLIPCVDPDGTSYNEVWFKGPFDLEHYVRGFYRPAGHEQVEWTFPIHYKELEFDSPLPETRGLMSLLERTKADFVFSLHNSAFGGAYWYSTAGEKDFCEKLELSAKRQGIPLHMGEAEAAYIKRYSQAVFEMMSMEKYYDDLISRGLKYPKMEHPCGTCCGDFMKYINPKSLVILAEVPYFYSSKIGDTSKSDWKRKDVLLANIRKKEEHYRFIGQYWEKLKQLFSSDNPFPQLVDMSVEAFDSEREILLSRCKEVEEDCYATVAEKYDNLYIIRYFECLNLGLIIRSCQFELENGSEEIDTEKKDFLQTMIEKTTRELERWCNDIKEHVDYQVISIRRLVSVQCETALLASSYLKEKSDME